MLFSFKSLSSGTRAGWWWSASLKARMSRPDGVFVDRGDRDPDPPVLVGRRVHEIVLSIPIHVYSKPD